MNLYWLLLFFDMPIKINCILAINKIWRITVIFEALKSKYEKAWYGFNIISMFQIIIMSVFDNNVQYIDTG